MYPVTDLYKSKIKEDGREFSCNITIEHSNGTLELTDEDISQGSLIYTESSQNGDEFTIGSTVASDISLSILKKPEYEDIQFMGATLFVTIGLYIQKGVDAHFLQPSQPSKMKGFEDKREYVPLGRFNIDDVNIQSSTIQLKAMDNMINLDKPYSLSKLSYPANLYQIYTNICSVGDISVGTLDFPNSSYIVNEKPSDDLTFRDILGYVAELSGTFAKCDRTGRLELKWYEPTDLVIEPEIRYSFTPSDNVVQIKGIMASTEDTTYLTGVEDYAIDLSENPLLQGDYETVLPNILANVEGVIFTPYESEIKGNPAIQSGDMIVQVDKNGTFYNTIVTKMVYKYRGRSSLEAKGLPNILKGYKGSTNRKLAEIRRKIDVEVGDKITDLEQAILEATELITGELGGYVLKRENELLIMDNPDPDLAVKVWRWNLGGLGYSSNGVNGTYELAMTMNGAINANFITTGLLSANLVKTGLLESVDGSSWFNLDTGEINIKDQLKFINGQLTLSGIDSGNKVFNTTPTTPYKINDLWKVSGVAGVDFRICTRARASGNYVASDWTNVIDSKNYADLIKNLTTGTAIKGGTTTIDNTKVRVTHIDGTYSEMNATGFFKQWANGRGDYLNDVEVIRGSSNTSEANGYLPNVYVSIPERFRGRQVKALVLPIETTFSVGRMDRYGDVLWIVDTPIVNYAKVTSIDTNTYMEARVLCGSEYEIAYDDGSSRQRYWLASFDLLLIGY